MSIQFFDPRHAAAYYQLLCRAQRNDRYHAALFYLLSLCPDCRTHIANLYDFAARGICPDALVQGWQTSTSYRVCLLAFNLFNGYAPARDPGSCTPENLFCCEYAPYFTQALKLRYPEYFSQEFLA